jgi:hypothetical protein
MSKNKFRNSPRANILVVIFLVVAVVGISLWKNNTLSLPSLPNILGSSTVNLPKDGTKAGDARLYPDPTITPGKAYENITKEDICTSGYSKRVRDVASSTKHKVYENYNLDYPKSDGSWEVDHFIPLGIGGSNDISNLWPEPANPKPGFLEKDVVESYLHTEICNGKIDIKVAQKMIQDDWYKVYLGIPKGFKF